MTNERGLRKTRTGKVTSTKMDKTAGISVDTPEDLERVERLIDKMKGLSDG